MYKLLIIDDDVDTCTLLSAYLKGKGYETDIAYSGNKGLQKFKAGNFDLILCDYRLGDREGMEVLKEVKQIDPKVKVIIITGYSDIKTAVRVIKEGAFDYISKPLIPDEVLNVISNAQKQESGPSEVADIREDGKKNQKLHKRGTSYQDEYLRGNDLAIRKLYKEVELVAATNYSIILYGESGTGKEVIAKTIHLESDRADKPFIALDCGTLSKELAGSELFGHVKGAFTGALGDKTGHFEMANGGTLFLDEVSNLSYDVQASLLRVIQERKLKRIGGTKQMDIDIRIIVASNENLEEAYHRGKFREDLFHRLNEFSIVLPPLRERKGDIPLFARYFLDKVNRELGKNITEFDEGVMDILVNYYWPGNIRELKNVIRRATLLAGNGKITKDNLPWNNSDAPFSGARNEIATEKIRYKGADDEMNLKESAYMAEYETVMNVLKQVNYNKSQAAVILKIDRKTLYNKLKKFREELFHDKN
jgi:two-component system response regulator HydG